MDDSFLIAAIIFFITFGIIEIILWVTMFSIIEANGKQVKSLFITLKQFKEFDQIIQKEENYQKKKKYRILFWSQIILIPVYFIGMIILFKFFIS